MTSSHFLDTMKTPRISFGVTKRAFLAVCALALIHTPVFASGLLTAGIDLGEAGPADHNWAIFTLGSSNTPSDLSNGAQIVGDVALAGSSKINIGGGSQVVGSVFKKTTGSVNISNGGQVTGGIQSSGAYNSMLSQGAADAVAASNAAFALSASAGYPTTINANQSLTLNGSGTVVLKLTDFLISGGGTLTLQGTASTTFVINVSRNFSINNGGSVKLAGGLSWDNVLFNVRGSGSTVTLAGGSQIMSGILLAANRTVSLENSAQFQGEIIADRVTLSGGAQVIRPPVVSP